MSQEAHKLLSELTFCVFDLETTGGNHDKDKIIEIGMVKIKNLKITEEKSFLIRPEIKVPDFIQKLTSISNKDLENAPVIEEVLEEIIEFMGDSILVAHNTSFDVPFFDSVLKRAGKGPLLNKSICTNLMTKYLIPNLMNSNLNYMSKIFGIPHKKAHRALDDARATAKLLLKYIDIFIDKDIQKINHLYYPRNRFELDRVNFDHREDLPYIEQTLKKIKCPYLMTVKGNEGIILLALPMTGNQLEIDFINKKLQTLQWERVTFRLFGSMLEAIVSFGGLFLKIDPDVRIELLQFLSKTHLNPANRLFSEEMGGNIGEENEREILATNTLGDFVITTHLVPEQYLIYPLTTIHERNALIFRYPGHRKKLVQFISTRGSKGPTKRASKQTLPREVREFIYEFLNKLNISSSKDTYLFDKKVAVKTQLDFFNTMDTFLADNPNPYNYPKEHIKKHYN